MEKQWKKLKKVNLDEIKEFSTKGFQMIQHIQKQMISLKGIECITAMQTFTGATIEVICDDDPALERKCQNALEHTVLKTNTPQMFSTWDPQRGTASLNFNAADFKDDVEIGIQMKRQLEEKHILDGEDTKNINIIRDTKNINVSSFKQRYLQQMVSGEIHRATEEVKTDASLAICGSALGELYDRALSGMLLLLGEVSKLNVFSICGHRLARSENPFLRCLEFGINEECKVNFIIQMEQEIIMCDSLDCIPSLIHAVTSGASSMPNMKFRRRYSANKLRAAKIALTEKATRLYEILNNQEICYKWECDEKTLQDSLDDDPAFVRNLCVDLVLTNFQLNQL